MPSPGRREVLQALTKHGLEESVAVTVRAVGVTVRQRTINDSKESGAFVDADSGELLGHVILGTANRLEASELLRQMLPGHRYVCIHAHPQDDSFSPHDAALVLRFRAVCVISAVGRHGAWFVLSVDPRQAPASLEAMVEAFTEAQAEIAPRYQALVQSGQLVRREAQSAATHEVWVRIAPTLGLRYDRVGR